MNELPSILMAVKVFHEVCTMASKESYTVTVRVSTYQKLCTGMYLEHVAETVYLSKHSTGVRNQYEQTG
jgi:hypothetical protein